MTVPRSTRSARDPWLDNARFILIALVVFGHFLEPLTGDHAWLATTYAFVYTFHMPAFAFLSGAVAQGTASDKLFRGVTFRLLWPFLVFQGLYALAALSPWWPDDGVTSVTTPYWLLWYLLSLAAWRMMLPLFAQLRHRMPIAVGVALLAGCFEGIGYDLSLSRTLVFFPLFLMGWSGARPWRDAGATTAIRCASVGVLAAVFAAVAWLQPDPRWLYGSYAYTLLDTGMLQGMVLRLLLLATAAVGTLAVLALTPRRHTWYSGFGERSLGAYVLQGFVIKLATGAGVFAVLAAWPGIALAPVLGIAAVVLAALLASSQVAVLLRPATAPRWLENRLWQPANAEHAGRRRVDVSARS